MAGSSFFALFDDIATILDDVSVLTKVAAKKTAGVLGDDLALNAQQVSGVPVNRELPVVWAVAGLHQQADPGAGGAADQRLRALGGDAAADGRRRLPVLRGRGEAGPQVLAARRHRRGQPCRARRGLQDASVDMVAFERDKIKGAIRTDFILSAEIIAITLGAVAEADFIRQVLVLSGIAIAMTIGVYGLVAGIVKLDDLGLYLSRKRSRAVAWMGERIVGAAPWLMKALSWPAPPPCSWSAAPS